MVKLGKIIGAENGGKAFLDEGVTIINRMVGSGSVLAGHNIGFDIQKLTGTMKQMGAYSSHEEAQDAIEKLHTMIEDGSLTVVDTLEYNRAYMNDLVNEAVDAEFNKTGLKRTESEVAKMHRNFMYSPETMADVRVGGGAAYASVEAMTLNTDLTARIARDAALGDESAVLLVKRLKDGSHLADTDTMLQSFILRYTVTSDKDDRLQLARPGGGKSNVVYQALAEDDKKIANLMNRQVYRSSATVPTRSIADVQHLSDTTFEYLLSDKGIRNVSLMNDDIENPGFIQYDTTKAKFMKNTSLVEEYSPGEAGVKRIIQSARLGEVSAINSIANFGISYAQDSRIQEMVKIAEAVRGVPAKDLTKDSILKSIGNVYRNFSPEPTVFDAIKISSTGRSTETPFTIGFGGSSLDEYLTKTIDTARAGKAGGMPYSFLDANTKMLNTIIAESTQGGAESAGVSIVKMMSEEGISPERRQLLQKQLDSLSYASHMDIFSETGLSHFAVQKEEFGLTGPRGLHVMEGTKELMPGQKLLLPTEILEDVVSKALGEDAMKKGIVSLSVVKSEDGNELINLFWKTASEEPNDYVQIAKQLVEDSLAADDARASMTHVDQSLTKTAQLERMGMTFNNTIRQVGKENLIDFIAKQIQEKGVGIANLDVKSSGRILKGLVALGLDITNDMLVKFSARYLGTAGDVARFSPFVDETALEAARKS